MVTVEERMGIDVRMDLEDTDDILIDSRSDFKKRTGLDNLKQAVINRIRTQIGELTLHPDYGSSLPSLIGTNANDFTTQLAKQHIREALLQEPRISSIDDVEVTFADNLKTTLTCEITVTPIDSFESLNIVFPFVLLGGDS